MEYLIIAHIITSILGGYLFMGFCDDPHTSMATCVGSYSEVRK